MKKNNKVSVPLLVIVVLIFSSCHSPKSEPDTGWNDLPTSTRLDSLKQTEFLPTLENPLSNGSNSIYASSLLYAWSKVKQELKSEVLADRSNSSDFKLLATSNSYKNALSDEEYNVSSSVNGDDISVRAFFKKISPFETKMDVTESPLVFLGAKVSAFGMNRYDEYIASFTQILYYKDSDNFVLKLIPKDKSQEIILAKGLAPYNTLAEGVEKVNQNIELGKKEMILENQSWKYQIREGDIFTIPVIRFNLATNYKTLEGQSFSTKNNGNYILTDVYQRTGFIFNENGAVIESDAYVAAAAADSVGEENIIPKQMIFNKPFLIMLKGKSAENPYFVMRVNNSELMVKR